MADEAGPVRGGQRPVERGDVGTQPIDRALPGHAAAHRGRDRVANPAHERTERVRRLLHVGGGQRGRRLKHGLVGQGEQPAWRDQRDLAGESLRVQKRDDVERAEPGADDEQVALLGEGGERTFVPGVDDLGVPVGVGDAGDDAGGEHHRRGGQRRAVAKHDAGGRHGDGFAAPQPHLRGAVAHGGGDARGDVAREQRPAQERMRVAATA